MNRITKFSIFIIALMICLSAFTSVLAADAPELFGNHVKDGKLDSLIFAKSDERLTKSNFTVKVGDKEYAPESLSSYNDTDYSTSWIIVIESANNFKAMESAVGALVETIVDSLSGADNMAIYTTYGDKYSFNTDRKTINTQVSDTMRKISNNPVDRKLYDAIYSGLNTFKTDTSLNDRKVLVVISDFTETRNVHSFDEVVKYAEDFEGAIYLVGLTQRFLEKKANFEAAFDLLDKNVSGDALELEVVTDDAGKSLGNMILDNEKNCRVLTSTLEPIEPTEEKALSVLVTLQSGNMRIDSNSLPINVADLPVVEETAEGAPAGEEGEPEEPSEPEKPTPTTGAESTAAATTPEAEATSEPTATEVVSTGFFNSSNSKYFLIGGGILLALIIAAIIIITQNKKKKQEAERRRKEEERRRKEEEERRRREEDERRRKVENPGGKTVPVGQSTVPVSKVTITLTKVESGETFKGEINDRPVKAGREQTIRLTGDPGISKSHMEFIWQNGVLYVQDTNSSNGTYVNKKKITGAVPLQQSDVIHAGSTDFRVNWHSNS